MPRMPFEELVRRMDAAGFDWDEDAFVPRPGGPAAGKLTMTIAQAEEFLRGWQYPGDEVRG